MTKFYTPIVFVGLAACGGSQSGPISSNIADIQSVSDLSAVGAPSPRVGFASTDSAILGGSAFTLRNAPNLTGPRLGTTPSANTTDFGISISNDGSEVTVVVDGKTHVLEAINSRPGQYTVSDIFLPDGEVDTGRLARVFAPNRYVEYLLYELQENGYPDPATIPEGFPLEPVIPLFDSTGLYVIGFETDPNMLDYVTGQAVYDGRMSLTIGGLDAYGYATGDVQLTVDFDNRELSGEASLRSGDKPGSTVRTDLIVSDIDITIGRSEVVDGSFSGTISIDQPFSVSNPFTNEATEAAPFRGEYDGRIYGPVLDSVGGQISGETTSVDGTEDLAIVGAFIGSR